MEIKLKLTEAIGLLEQHIYAALDSDESIRVEIEYPKEPVINRTYVPISADSIYQFAGVNGERKIAAIKLLREATPGLGLADAKKIVEAIMMEGKDCFNDCNSDLSRADWIATWNRLHPS